MKTSFVPSLGWPLRFGVYARGIFRIAPTAWFFLMALSAVALAYQARGFAGWSAASLAVADQKRFAATMLLAYILGRMLLFMFMFPFTNLAVNANPQAGSSIIKRGPLFSIMALCVFITALGDLASTSPREHVKQEIAEAYAALASPPASGAEADLVIWRAHQAKTQAYLAAIESNPPRPLPGSRLGVLNLHLWQALMKGALAGPPIGIALYWAWLALLSAPRRAKRFISALGAAAPQALRGAKRAGPALGAAMAWTRERFKDRASSAQALFQFLKNTPRLALSGLLHGAYFSLRAGAWILRSAHKAVVERGLGSAEETSRIEQLDIAAQTGRAKKQGAGASRI